MSKKEKFKVISWSIMIVSILVIILGVVIMQNVSFRENESLATFGIILVGLGAIVFSLPFIFKDYINKKIESEIKNEQELYEKKLELYKQCKQKGIYDLDSAKNIDKFELLAQSYGFKRQSLASDYYTSLFNEIKNMSETKADSEKQQKELKQKNYDTLKKQFLEKYALYVGRDKRLAILKDELAELESKLKSANKLTNYYSNPKDLYE